MASLEQEGACEDPALRTLGQLRPNAPPHGRTQDGVFQSDVHRLPRMLVQFTNAS